jgi:glycerol kinase
VSEYVVAIDQGTTSTRAIVFDHSGSIVSVGQKEHEQIFPRAGWVEHDPAEIWDNTREVIGQALSRADITRHDVVAVGITNQRETAVVWDKTTGKPVYNAIVWQDTRTQDIVERLSEDGGPSRPTSRAPRSSGSSRMSKALARRRRPATCSSERPTPGCSGTSPAEPTGVCTSRT